MKIECNHVYLMQPSMNIFVEHGLLRVSKQDRTGRAVNLPINLFFKSLGLYPCFVTTSFYIRKIKLTSVGISERKQLASYFQELGAMAWMALGPSKSKVVW